MQRPTWPRQLGLAALAKGRRGWDLHLRRRLRGRRRLLRIAGLRRLLLPRLGRRRGGTLLFVSRCRRLSAAACWPLALSAAARRLLPRRLCRRHGGVAQVLQWEILGWRALGCGGRAAPLLALLRQALQGIAGDLQPAASTFDPHHRPIMARLRGEAPRPTACRQHETHFRLALDTLRRRAASRGELGRSHTNPLCSLRRWLCLPDVHCVRYAWPLTRKGRCAQKNKSQLPAYQAAMQGWQAEGCGANTFSCAATSWSCLLTQQCAKDHCFCQPKPSQPT